MKRILMTVAAAMLATGTAVAQPPQRAYGYDAGRFWRGAPDNPWERIQFLQERVDRGVADGSLNRREADRVRRELDGVRNWVRRMHWHDDGRLTIDQRGRVQARLDQISQQIHWLRHNGW